jgi:beta-glucosidase
MKVLNKVIAFSALLPFSKTTSIKSIHLRCANFGIALTFSFWAQSQTALPRLGVAPIPTVVKAMTLEEKANLVVGNGLYLPGVYVSGVTLKEPKGGQARVPGAGGSTYEIPRLGIPSMVMSDGTGGLNVYYSGKGRINYATAFPTGTLLASSWNEATLRKVGEQYGREAKEKGVDIVLAPAINIHRNPLGGRNYEYFSEDPVVSGVLSAALIEGLQSKGVGASIKHYAANNQETNRGAVNTIASERALREIYLRGFEIAIKKSHPLTIMSSYNLINGAYTSERPDLIRTIPRKEWGFKGFVMTDWTGGKDPVAQMQAGNNLLMPGSPNQTKQILDAVKSGKLSEAVLDENVSEILNVMLQSSTFKKYRYTDKLDLESGGRIAREAAEEGIVLLKNNAGTLPFNKQIHIVALFGNSGYDILAGGKGIVNPPYKISLAEGLARLGYTTEQGLQTLYSNYLNEWLTKNPKKNMLQEFFSPTPLVEEYSVDEKTVAKAVENADVAVISIVQRTAEGTDRTPAEFSLVDKQKELIRKVAAAFHQAGKKIVVVLNIAAPVEVTEWRDLADAIVFAGIPGQEGGIAIANVLSGEVNPSGKLATTFPVKYEDVPSAKNFPGKEFPEKAIVTAMGKSTPSEVVYEEGIYVGYRYFNSFGVKPAYPFGFGLSYTQFAYSNLKLGSPSFSGKLTACVTVTNTGKAAGKEVVQLYVTAPTGKLDKPSLELKAFAKTTMLQPGGTQTLTFTLLPKDLASFNTEQSAWIADAGTYVVKIGASSEDIRLTKTFTLPKETMVEKVNKALTPEVPINELKRINDARASK